MGLFVKPGWQGDPLPLGTCPLGPLSLGWGWGSFRKGVDLWKDWSTVSRDLERPGPKAPWEPTPRTVGKAQKDP